MKKIIISVSNDLFSDQRVHKVCNSLLDIGFEITLLGRILPNSASIKEDKYKILRFKLLFNRGPIFYANLNIRLFFYLLFHKADLLLANDLDTLLANYIISKIKRIPLVYDSHEYFTEVPELQGKFAKRIWEKIENYIFPKLKSVITVNDSIANIYNNKYGNKIFVIKNLPKKLNYFKAEPKSHLNLPFDGKYIILQGAGINIDRGAEELVLAMLYVENIKLLIVGDGDVLPILKKLVIENSLENKVVFIQKQAYEKLRSFTYYAEIGISLDKNTNLNYKYSLPNKIFDYMQLGVPILASDLPEVKKVVLENNIGLICENHNPKTIANCINTMISEDYKNIKKVFLEKASEKLNWESQKEILETIYCKYL